MLIEGHRIGKRAHRGPEGLEKRAVTKAAGAPIALAHGYMAEESACRDESQHRLAALGRNARAAILKGLLPRALVGGRVCPTDSTESGRGERVSEELRVVRTDQGGEGGMAPGVGMLEPGALEAPLLLIELRKPRAGLRDGHAGS